MIIRYLDPWGIYIYRERCISIDLPVFLVAGKESLKAPFVPDCTSGLGGFLQGLRV